MQKSINRKEEIENQIIDSITFGVGGRLVAFKPENGPKGVDLIVEKRSGYDPSVIEKRGGFSVHKGKNPTSAKIKEKGISFQIISFSGHLEGSNFTADILDKDLTASKNLYLMFVYFNEIKGQINEFVWIVPSLDFKNIADQIKSLDGEVVLRFEASLDADIKNKYSKFLINKRDLGGLLIKANDSGKINFKDVIFSENKEVNLDRLKEFISEARRNTYAGDATPVDNPRLLGSIQLGFQKSDYFYQDIYFDGKDKFIGQEIVYHNNIPVWGMSYIGQALDKNTVGFLKESLIKLSTKCRFGLSCDFERRDFKYRDQGQGDIKNFNGQEQIFFDGKLVYTLNYRGGII